MQNVVTKLTMFAKNKKTEKKYSTLVKTYNFSLN